MASSSIHRPDATSIPCHRGRLSDTERAEGHHELPSRVGRKRAQEDLLGLLRGLIGLPESVTTRVGQLNDVLAPVRGILAPQGEALALEIVNERDHRGPVDPHPAGDIALRQRIRAVDSAQDGGLLPADAQGREGGAAELGKPQLGVLEQVPEALRHRRGRLGAVILGGHESKSTNRLIISTTDDQLCCPFLEDPLL